MGADELRAEELDVDVAFAIVPEWLLDAEVSDRAVRLYALLGRYADRGGRAFPARKTIAGRLGCSVDSIDRALASLIRIGALEKSKRLIDGRQTSNDYRLIRGAAPARPGGRKVAAGGAAPVRPLEREPDERRERADALSRQRRRDLIFEALCTALGCALDDVPNGKVARGPWNAAVSSLKADGASPEQIIGAGALWPTIFPDARLTPTALAKHFPQLRGQLAADRELRERSAPCPECGVGGGHTADCPRAA